MNWKNGVSWIVSLAKTRKAKDKWEKVNIDGLPVMYKALAPDDVVSQVCTSCKYCVDTSAYFWKESFTEALATGEFMRCSKIPFSREQLIRNVFQLIKETFDLEIDKELLESYEVLFTEWYNKVTWAKVIFCKIVQKGTDIADYDVEIPLDSPELAYASCEVARQSMQNDEWNCSGFENEFDKK